jgi:hypothetical protein
VFYPCSLIVIYMGVYLIETTGLFEPPPQKCCFIAPWFPPLPYSTSCYCSSSGVFSLAVHQYLMKRVLLAVCRRDALVRPVVTASTAAQCPGIDRSISRFPGSPTSGVAYLLAVHQHLMPDDENVTAVYLTVVVISR